MMRASDYHALKLARELQRLTMCPKCGLPKLAVNDAPRYQPFRTSTIALCSCAATFELTPAGHAALVEEEGESTGDLADAQPGEER